MQCTNSYQNFTLIIPCNFYFHRIIISILVLIVLIATAYDIYFIYSNNIKLDKTINSSKDESEIGETIKGVKSGDLYKIQNIKLS